MGLFKRRSADRGEVAQLRQEIAGIAARLEAADAAKAELTTRVHTIANELDERMPARPPTPLPADPPPRIVRESDIEMLRARIERLNQRLETPPPAPPPAPHLSVVPPPGVTDEELAAVRDQLSARIDALLERLDRVDERITSISTELANQLDELGAETDQAVQASAALRDSQTKLANEQARYQIAFRQDLAELAERLRR
jgi:DNA repair exonuclease SbcCD ATPase subunit